MKRITYTEAQALKIQHWGEQDQRIHNAEMKRWRKKWRDEDKKRCDVCKSLSCNNHDCIPL